MTQWLSTEQAASHLGLKANTLYKWRRMSRGPKFFKNGSVVRYRMEDLDDFLTEFDDPVSRVKE